MKLFTVKIGRRTRRGNFEEFASKAVSTSNDDVNWTHVRNHFQNRYEGFEVIVTEVKEIKDITDTILTPPKEAHGSLSDFYIKYTEEEQAIHSEYREVMENATEILNKLHRSIRDRYYKLSYVDGSRSMYLETTGRETICKRLNIKSQDFFKVVKSGVEDIKEDIKEEEPSFDTTPSTPQSALSVTEPFIEEQLVVNTSSPNDDDEANDIPF